MKRKPKAADPIGPGGPSRYDWGKTWKAVAGGVLLIVLVNIDRLPALKFLSGNIFWLFLLVPFGYKTLQTSLLNSAVRRSDYDAALKKIRWFHFCNAGGLEPVPMSSALLVITRRRR